MGKSSFSKKNLKRKSLGENNKYKKKRRNNETFCILKEHQKYDINWTEKDHYGQCGQSCPCCRWKIGQEIFGSCEICKNKEIYIN